ncbi:MAG: DUF6178 family protein [Deltaproteobacteria bacterium]|jgi:hypothetical protein|nr:DUF6178 family protein [Deltaproteobacteria bacterium]
MTANKPDKLDSNLLKAVKLAKLTNSIDPLLEIDGIDKIIPKLPAYDLYAIITKTGLNDAIELIEYATPQQIQIFLDFDCWNKDKIRLARYLDWLQALLHIGFEKIGNFVDEIDPSMTGYFLIQSAHIFNLKEQTPPEFNDAIYYQTPDLFFELRPKAGINEDVWKALMELIDNLYRYNIELALHILSNSMWDTSFNLQENAYKASKDRLEMLGFWDYYDALSVYRMTDPARIKLDEKTRDYIKSNEETILPVLPSVFKKESSFHTAYKNLRDNKAEEINKAVLHLINKMAAADRVTPDDDEGFSRIIKLAFGSINLGIAYVSKNKENDFNRALNNISISRLFSCGYSLGLQLKTLALTLSRSGHISISPRTSTLLEGDWLRFYNAITKGHPTFHLGLLDREEEVFFTSLEQISFAGTLIEDMSKLKVFVFNYLKIPPEILTEEGLKGLSRKQPGEITFGDMLRTSALSFHYTRNYSVKSVPAKLVNQFEQDRTTMKPVKFYEKITDVFAEKLDDKLKFSNLHRIIKTNLEPLFTQTPLALYVVSEK